MGAPDLLLDSALQATLEAIADGATHEQALSRFPELAEELRPLLWAADEVSALPGLPILARSEMRLELERLAREARSGPGEPGGGTAPPSGTLGPGGGGLPLLIAAGLAIGAAAAGWGLLRDGPGGPVGGLLPVAAATPTVAASVMLPNPEGQGSPEAVSEGAVMPEDVPTPGGPDVFGAESQATARSEVGTAGEVQPGGEIATETGGADDLDRALGRDAALAPDMDASSARDPAIEDVVGDEVDAEAREGGAPGRGAGAGSVERQDPPATAAAKKERVGAADPVPGLPADRGKDEAGPGRPPASATAGVTPRQGAPAGPGDGRVEPRRPAPTQPASPPESPPPPPTELRIDRSFTGLAGRLLDERGQALPEAYVLAYREDGAGPWLIDCEEDGAWRLDLPAGAYRLRLVLDETERWYDGAGRRSEATLLEVRPGQALVDILLRSGDRP